MTIPKLKYSEVAKTRASMLQSQGGTCALCSLPIAKGKDVLDHDHTEGHLRGVLHSGCNSLLGRVENNYRRYGVPDLRCFLAGASMYLTKSSRIPMDQRVLHPTFKTLDEKREARNATARKRRAAKKAKESGS